MNNKTLGILALVGAPTLFLGNFAESRFPNLSNSWFTVLYCTMYITAWMCSMVVIRRTGICGDSWLGRRMPLVLMTTLTIANLSNLFWLVPPDQRPGYFFYIDMFWPLSHLLMLVVGVLTLRAGRLRGWKRFTPLLMGTWLPFALACMAAKGRSEFTLVVPGIYNALAVVLLAWVVRGLPDEPRHEAQTTNELRAAWQ